MNRLTCSGESSSKEGRACEGCSEAEAEQWTCSSFQEHFQRVLVFCVRHL